MTRVTLVDVTLRDGSHTVRHQFTAEQVTAVTRGLISAGVEVIEVSHGDGLGGSSLTYGRSLVGEMELIGAAVREAAGTSARIAVLLLPGIGTVDELEEAWERGARVVRVATHATEADIAIDHIGKAREIGFETYGFLMMAHMVAPDELAEQAKIQEAAGATAVYCTDSAGALTPRSAAARVDALRRSLAAATRVGFHAHNNLGLAVGNTIAAIEHGAELIDAATRGVGAGAGNCATEAIAAAADKLGIDLGISVPAIADVAEEIVSQAVPTRPALDRASLMLGWAGVYSSFLLHAEAAARRYDVPTAEILVELGRLGVVGGQEDMIIDVAIRLAERGERAPGRR